ncbi:flippase-like domain-containing protein, partial [bacterium AH-315-P07]|nr:flippase-like domain-containing protein [bacterium AH-315-P07]
KTSKKNLANFLKLVVGISLISWLLYSADIHEVANVLADARINYLLTAVFLFVILLATFTLRLHLLVKHVTESFLETGRLVIVSYFFNSFLPSGIGGDSYKVIYLRRRIDSWSQVLALVTLDRVVGLFVITVAGIVYTLLADIPSGFFGTSESMDGGRLLLIAIATGILIAGMMGLGAWKNETLRTRLKKIVLRVRSLLSALPPRTYVALLLISVISHIARILRFYVYLLCFGVDFAIVDLVFVLFVMQVVVLLPISIGGLGLQEGTIAYCLSLFGVPLPVGLAVGLLNRAILWLASLVGGLVFLLPSSRR